MGENNLICPLSVLGMVILTLSLSPRSVVVQFASGQKLFAVINIEHDVDLGPTGGPRFTFMYCVPITDVPPIACCCHSLTGQLPPLPALVDVEIVCSSDNDGAAIY